MIGSGRTDSGVHALGQIANFKSQTRIETDKIKIALNANLPKSIRIIKSEEVDMGFNSRFDAKGKTYLYQIYNDRVSDPFHSRYSYFVPSRLDFEKMKYASSLITGTHDYRGFMASGSDVKTTERTIYSTEMIRENEMIKFQISGSGFLYNMVRIIVGTLVDIGKGTKDIDCIEEALQTQNRRVLGHTARPEGLFLKEVYY